MEHAPLLVIYTTINLVNSAKPLDGGTPPPCHVIDQTISLSWYGSQGPNVGVSTPFRPCQDVLLDLAVKSNY